jgi:hypothetical protein
VGESDFRGGLGNEGPFLFVLFFHLFINVGGSWEELGGDGNGVGVREVCTPGKIDAPGVVPGLGDLLLRCGNLPRSTAISAASPSAIAFCPVASCTWRTAIFVATTGLLLPPNYMGWRTLLCQGNLFRYILH